MTKKASITACYAFVNFSHAELKALHQELLAFGPAKQMKGLILLASEGLNATVCGNPAAIAEWKMRLRKIAPEMAFKDSCADREIFRRWSVKIKPEIVALKEPAIKPEGRRNHVSPEEWQEMMKADD